MAGLIHPIHIILADDDPDDVLLFREALEEIHLPLLLTIVSDGEQLITLLKELQPLPDILFLDLNMPKKNGFDCLSAIKQMATLHRLPVVIFSTSHEITMINQLYLKGAHFYIQKPTDFTILRNVIQQAITLATNKNNKQPPRDKFELLF